MKQAELNITTANPKYVKKPKRLCVSPKNAVYVTSVNIVETNKDATSAINKYLRDFNLPPISDDFLLTNK